MSHYDVKTDACLTILTSPDLCDWRVLREIEQVKEMMHLEVRHVKRSLNALYHRLSMKTAEALNNIGDDLIVRMKDNDDVLGRIARINLQKLSLPHWYDTVPVKEEVHAVITEVTTHHPWMVTILFLDLDHEAPITG